MNPEPLNCPGCDQPITLLESNCLACGLEFNKASHLIEQALSYEQKNIESALPLVSPRIGEFLVEMEVLTLVQLNETLQEQRNQVAQGNRKQLGHIMVEKGFTDAKTIDYYVALHALHLKLQLIVGLMNHAITTNRSQMISEPIRNMREDLLHFVAVVNKHSSS